MKAPSTGNSDCDLMIKQTFVRREHTSALMGTQEPQLLIKAHPYDTVLSYDQTRGLIRYLMEAFCASCQGTGFDPDTLDGRCEVCNLDMPF